MFNVSIAASALREEAGCEAPLRLYGAHARSIIVRMP
jgi:hypothetical protein